MTGQIVAVLMSAIGKIAVAIQRSKIAASSIAYLVCLAGYILMDAG